MNPDPAHPTGHVLDRPAVDADAARIYSRVGFLLLLSLIIVTVLTWTGFWSYLLNVGHFGWLHIEDLTGYLIVATVLLALGLFLLLFTMRASMKQIERDLIVADLRVDAEVRALRSEDAHQRVEMEATIAKQRAAWENEAHRAVAQATESMHAKSTAETAAARAALTAVTVKAERQLQASAAAYAQESVRAGRAELDGFRTELDDRLRQVEATAVRNASATLLLAQGGRGPAHANERASAFEARFAEVTADAAAREQAVRDEMSTAILRLESTLDGAVMRDEVTRLDRDARLRHAETAASLRQGHEELQASLIRARAELLRSLDERMEHRVAEGAREAMRAAVQAAFSRGRFYRALGIGLIGAVFVVLVLAGLGVGAPGWFPLETAFMATGVALAVLVITLAVLIFSFSDVVKMLRRHLD